MALRNRLREFFSTEDDDWDRARAKYQDAPPGYSLTPSDPEWHYFETRTILPRYSYGGYGMSRRRPLGSL